MTVVPAEPQTLELRRYLLILRRRWPTVLLGALLGLAAGVLYLVVVPTTASASTLVNVNVISAEPFNNPREPSGLIDAQTEVQTARSSAVVTAVADRLGDRTTPSEVRSAVAAEVYNDATVVRITYTADSPATAVAGATAVAEAYLDYRSELAQAKLETITAQLSDRRDILRGQLVAVNRVIASAPAGSNRATQALSDQQLLSIELDSLLNQLNAASGIDTRGGNILTAASDNEVPVRPRTGFVLAVALLAGLILGAALTFARNALDRRVFDSYDVREAIGAPVIASMGSSSQAGTDIDPTDLEAVRGLRERLLAMLPERGSVLAVADVGRSSQPSEVALGLSRAMAEAGRSVELVLAEYPSAFLERVSGKLGLVPDTASPDVAGLTRYRMEGTPGVTVTVAGDGGSSRPAAGLLLESLSDENRSADITVFAMPPRSTSSLRLAAGRLGHSLIAVVSSRDTRIDDLIRLAEEMRAVGARIHGTVMVPRKR